MPFLILTPGGEVPLGEASVLPYALDVLTYAWPLKTENLAAAVALHFMYNNFARPHKTLGTKITPRWRRGSPVAPGRVSRSRRGSTSW
jgi:hypothetical protein